MSRKWKQAVEDAGLPATTMPTRSGTARSCAASRRPADPAGHGASQVRRHDHEDTWNVPAWF